MSVHSEWMYMSWLNYLNLFYFKYSREIISINQPHLDLDSVLIISLQSSYCRNECHSFKISLPVNFCCITLHNCFSSVGAVLFFGILISKTAGCSVWSRSVAFTTPAGELTVHLLLNIPVTNTPGDLTILPDDWEKNTNIIWFIPTNSYWYRITYCNIIETKNFTANVITCCN